MDSKQDSKIKGSSSLLIIYTVVAVFCLLINLRALYIVLYKSKRKSRPANILVAHLSVVAIVLICGIFAYVLAKSDELNLDSPGLCNIPSFLSHAMYNLFSLNVATIIWMRTRNDPVNQGKRLAFGAIGIMWTIVVLSNLPFLLFAKYVKLPERKCEKMYLLGSLAVTTAFEGVRVFLFNVMVCIYIIRVTLKLQSSIKYLQIQLNQSERTLRGIQQVQVVQLHSIISMLTFFPNGIVAFLFKIISRLGWSSYTDSYTLPLTFLVYIELVIFPLSYVYLLQEVTILKFFIPCWPTKNIQNSMYIGDNIPQSDFDQFRCNANQPLKPLKVKSVTWSNKTGVQIQGNFRKFEPSFLTTVGITKSLSLPKIVLMERPVQNASSTPALQMPLTSQNQRRVTVEVHVEPENCNAENDIRFV